MRTHTVRGVSVMSRNIDADALMQETMKARASLQMLDNTQSADKMLQGLRMVEILVENAPTIESKRGRWINEHEDGHGSWVGTCDQCNKENRVDNFCPNCGADMRGAENE